jgi:serine/threonine-protein kinase 24/25/MST4
LISTLTIYRNTVCHDEEQDGWVFDTVKAPTMTVAKHTQKRRKIESLPIPLESPTGTIEMLQQLDLQSSINYKPLPFTSTVRKISETRKVSPSQKLSTTKRRTSGQKKPLGPNLNFGNSPSTVRQFRRVSDKSVDTKAMAPPKPAVDENNALATAPTETPTKEALLGKRAYSKSVGITCQEVLDNTSDQEKREAISRLAEAWSELEMKDPEGMYHILKLSMERIQRYFAVATFLSPVI